MVSSLVLNEVTPVNTAVKMVTKMHLEVIKAGQNSVILTISLSRMRKKVKGTNTISSTCFRGLESVGTNIICPTWLNDIEYNYCLCLKIIYFRVSTGLSSLLIDPMKD